MDTIQEQATSQEPELVEMKIGEKEYKIPKEVQVFFGKTIENTRKEIVSKKNQELSAFQKQIEEMSLTMAQKEELLNKFEEQSLTDKERQEKQLKKERENLSKKINELESEMTNWKSSFESEKISNQIYAAIGKHDVHSPDQTLKLLLSDAKPRLEKTDSGYSVVVSIINEDGDYADVSPSEAVRIFLSRPENMNLIKNNLNRGAGTQSAGRVNANGSYTFKRSELQDSKKRQEYANLLKDKKEVSIID